MNTVLKLSILLVLAGIANCQVCQTPTGFKAFNAAEYAKGIWYATYFQASMQTPLTSGCSSGTATGNSTHIIVSVTAKANGTTDTMTIATKIVAPGNMKWQQSSLSYKGINIVDINFNYYVFYYDSNIACVYITGKVMTYISVNIVMIQSRAKTITDAQFTTAKTYYSKCNLGTGKWNKINQSC